MNLNLFLRTIPIVLLLCLFRPLLTMGQTPATDQTWELVWHDEFNGKQIDQSKWMLLQPWGNDTSHGAALRTNDYSNHAIGGGTVKLITRKEDKWGYWNQWPGPVKQWKLFHYTTAMLYSRVNFDRGYFEIRCRIPDYRSSNPTATEAFGPNCFLYNENKIPTDPTKKVYQSEIDLFEFMGYRNNNAGCGFQPNYFTSNIHYRDGSMSKKWNWGEIIGGDNIDYFCRSIDFENNTFHTFGFEWDVHFLSVYIDDELYRTYRGPFAGQLIPMPVIIDINAPAYNFGNRHFPANSVFPYIYEIDYVRYYKFKADCKAELKLCNFNFSLYQEKLRRKISVGGNGCQAIVPQGEEVSLRASEEIVLNEGFSVEKGAEFFMEINSCEKSTITNGTPGSGGTQLNLN